MGQPIPQRAKQRKLILGIQRKKQRRTAPGTLQEILRRATPEILGMKQETVILQIFRQEMRLIIQGILKMVIPQMKIIAMLSRGTGRETI